MLKRGRNMGKNPKHLSKKIKIRKNQLKAQMSYVEALLMNLRIKNKQRQEAKRK